MYRFKTSCHLTFFFLIIPFIFFASSISAIRNEKLKLCVPRGLESTHLKKVCQILEKMTNVSISVRCVFAQDRMECARLILDGQADFVRLNPSDLIVMSTINLGDTVVSGELRASGSNDLYQYTVMLVARKEEIHSSRNNLNLKGVRLCLPGYEAEPEEDWTPFYSHYLELHQVSQICEKNITIVEDRIHASSLYLNSACIAGPWSIYNDLELKSKYKNLCSLCAEPGHCSEHDPFYGRRGSLICLTDGSGHYAWARLNDIQGHIKTTKEDSSQYVLICTDGSWQRIDTPYGCDWIQHPWPVILSHKKKGSRVSEFMAALIGTNSEEQANALDLIISPKQKDLLLRLMTLYGKMFEPLEPVSTETFLTKGSGLLEAFNLFRKNRCYKPVRLCVKNQIEMTKCQWLASASLVWTATSQISCILPNPEENCMEAVKSNLADAVIIHPNELHEAIRNYQLKILLHEWQSKMSAANPEIPTLGIVVKASTNFQTFTDLRGLKACIPKRFGFTWKALQVIFHKENILPSDCSWNESHLLHYFQEVKIMDSDLESMHCLGKDYDVSFVNLMNVSNHLNSSYKTICYSNNKNNIIINNLKFCAYSWVSSGQLMIHKDLEPWRTDDIANTFQAAAAMFSGDPRKTAVDAFQLFAPFNGKKNILFHDSTTRLLRDDSQIIQNAIRVGSFWKPSPFEYNYTSLPLCSSNATPASKFILNWISLFLTIIYFLR